MPAETLTLKTRFQQAKRDIMGLGTAQDKTANATKRLNQRFRENGDQSHFLRQKHTGLRREVSALRNDILLISFALGLFKTTLIDSITASERWRNSLLGVSSVARNTGNSITEVKQAAIALTQDGLLSLADAAAALKNLLATKFNLPEAVQIMHAFKNAAAFNRQGTLEFGNAIVRATEGIKNQISALVDNVGITKNLSVIMRERGFQMEDISDKTKGASARQALYNGLLEEAALFEGDAARLADTYSGSLSRLKNISFETQASFGLMLTQGAGVQGVFTKMTKSSLEHIKTIKAYILENKPLIEGKLQQSYQSLSEIFSNITMVLTPLLKLAVKIADIFVNTWGGRVLLQLKIFTKLLAPVWGAFTKIRSHADSARGSISKAFKIPQPHITAYDTLTKRFETISVKGKSMGAVLNSTLTKQQENVKNLQQSYNSLRRNQVLSDKKHIAALNRTRQALYKNKIVLKDLDLTQRFFNGSLKATVPTMNRVTTALGRLAKTNVFSTEQRAGILAMKKEITATGKVTKAMELKMKALGLTVTATGVKVRSFTGFIGMLKLGMIKAAVSARALGVALKSIIASTIIGLGITMAIGFLLTFMDTEDEVITKTQELSDRLNNLSESFAENKQAITSTMTKMEDITQKARDLYIQYGYTQDRMEKYNEVIEAAGKISEDFGNDLQNLYKTFKDSAGDVDTFTAALERLSDVAMNLQLRNLDMDIAKMTFNLQVIESEMRSLYGMDPMNIADIFKFEAMHKNSQEGFKLLFESARQEGGDAIAEVQKKYVEFLSTSSAMREKLYKRDYDKYRSVKQNLIAIEEQFGDPNMDNVNKIMALREKEGDFIRKVTEDEQKLLNSLIAQRNALDEALLTREKIDVLINKSSTIDPNKVLTFGLSSDAAKQMQVGLDSIDEMIAKVNTFKSGKKVAFDVMRIDDIITNKDIENVKTFKETLKAALIDPNKEIRYMVDGTMTVAKNFDALTEHVDLFGESIKSSFVQAFTSFRGTKEEGLVLLKRLKEMGKSFGTILKSMLPNTKETLSEIERFLQSMDRKIAGARAPKLPLFESLQKQLNTLDKQLEQIAGRGANTAQVEMAKKLIQTYSELSKQRIIKKLTDDTIENVKSLKLQEGAIQLVRGAYTDIHGTAYDYYQEVGQMGLKLANIEKRRGKDVYKIEQEMQALRLQGKLITDNIMLQLIDEIIATNALAAAKRQLLLDQQALQIQQTLSTQQVRAARGSQSVLKDILGFNPIAAKMELAAFRQEQINERNAFDKKLEAQVNEDNLSANEAINKNKEFVLAQEQAFYNKKLEIAQQITEKIAELGWWLIEQQMNAENTQVERMKDRLEVETTLLQEQFNRREISRKDFEKRDAILRKKSEIDQRASTRLQALNTQKMIADQLKHFAKLWFARGIAALGDPLTVADAPKWFAAAAFAGLAGASMAANIAQKERDIQKEKELASGRADTYRGTGRANTTRTTEQGGEIGGTISAQEMNITIAPSVTISGDTIVVGNVGIEELQIALERVVVDTTKSAIENGEINVGELTNGNVGA